MQGVQGRDQEPWGTPRSRLVLAGASGSIGTAMCRALLGHHEITVLTRSRARAEQWDPDLPIRWRQCDLFRAEEVERALEDFELAIYLVNNMTPSARLNQAQCRDMDVLTADTFGRAAARAGLRQIVYLGLLIPQGEVPADVVQSREEVPAALGAHGTPVTTIRTGLIVARGGTFARLVADLATRPPVIPLPRWANGRKHPVALQDVVRAVQRCLDEPSMYDQSFDLGGPRTFTVREILAGASRMLGAGRPVIQIPGCPAFLYRWWVRLVARDLHPELARTLVETLRYDAVARDNALQRLITPRASSVRRALRAEVREEREDLPARPRADLRQLDDADLRADKRMRSIQRLVLPPGRDAAWVADHYFFQWLPRFLLHTIVAQRDHTGLLRVAVRWPRFDILRMREVPERSGSERRLYHIEGGALARMVGGRAGRLEFREVLGRRYVLAAIHDYSPKLPWHVYVATQATVHLVAMKAYQKHLRRLGA